MKIIILGEVISKKNSMRVIVLGPRYSLRASKAYSNYERDLMPCTKVPKKKRKPCIYPGCLHRLPPYIGPYPVEMHFKLFRKTKRAFDYNNLAQGPQDLLVQAGVIAEDDMNHVIPVFTGPDAGWEIDKDNPRVEITIK